MFVLMLNCFVLNEMNKIQLLTEFVPLSPPTGAPVHCGELGQKNQTGCSAEDEPPPPQRQRRHTSEHKCCQSNL